MPSVSGALVTSGSKTELSKAASLWRDPKVGAELSQGFPSSYEAVAKVWSTAVHSRSLTPRMTELILLAMHASASSLDEAAIARHVERAKSAGASDSDIIDVLMTIAGVATHALYSSAPIVIDELRAAGIEPDHADDHELAAYEKSKAAYLAARGGFWNPSRDLVAEVMPRLATALLAQSAESWKGGSLTIKEREFICIAIDCTVTHTYEAGLRLHLKRAIAQGASARELIDVIQLATLLGFEGFVIGAEALVRARTTG